MIKFISVSKSYKYKHVFNNFSTHIAHKEFVCIVGSSGIGKSTFFNLLIGKEAVDDGVILIDDIAINNLKSNHLQYYRRKIGVIFQDFNLLDKKTVYENIAFILEICGEDEKNIFSKVKKVLEIVNLSEKIGHFPYELSGGERQRVAIARSIVHSPKIILADEPTGNLDQINKKMVIDTLKLINQKLGVTILLATHDPQILQYTEARIINLEDQNHNN